ncbi:hypothetical protein FAM09_10855 [Niastella caeni]|uniref:Lipoprotein n=1 Tax=Niastella caeni TaxID=2569763 RepID=A0A4S8HX93_9BACT|nr:hypothetical protein [Niastella caeni]THU40358.1 hypothetical protein FAM09_10855 [Niastella caeni]
MKIKHLQAFVVSCLIISCGNNATQPAPTGQPAMKGNTQVETAQLAQATSDTAKWINSFREFRDAVYQRKKEKVKPFIEFPIASHEIWYLVGDDSKTNVQTDESIPFTEKDFEKHYSKLFFKEFVNCLLKVKTEELYKSGKYQTPSIKDGTTTYVLYCTVDKTDNILTLNLNSNSRVDIGNGEYESGEGSTIYIFAILPNGKIKLKKLQMAG